jgi:hypothetical protein
VPIITEGVVFMNENKEIISSMHTKLVRLIQPSILNVVVYKMGLVNDNRLLQSSPQGTK